LIPLHFCFYFSFSWPQLIDYIFFSFFKVFCFFFFFFLFAYFKENEGKTGKKIVICEEAVITLFV